MLSLLFKWLMIYMVSGNSAHILHPVYISVTEIEYNKGSLEVSTRIFTDDFEKTLRQETAQHVDLIHPEKSKGMEKLVAEYLQKNLQITVNGKIQPLRFVGFEQLDEATYSYFEAKEVPEVKSIEVRNRILYDYEKRQVNVMHITVNGKRESTKLGFPDERFELKF